MNPVLSQLGGFSYWDYVDKDYVDRDNVDRDYVDREYVDRDYVNRDYVDWDYVDRDYVTFSSNELKLKKLHQHSCQSDG